jgi:hypothetical protein
MARPDEQGGADEELAKGSDERIPSTVSSDTSELRTVTTYLGRYQSAWDNTGRFGTVTSSLGWSEKIGTIKTRL